MMTPGAGTYVVVGLSQLSKSLDGVYTLSIRKSQQSSSLGEVRNPASGGGGACITLIVTLVANETLELRVFQALNSGTVKAVGVAFKAVRINPGIEKPSCFF